MLALLLVALTPANMSSGESAVFTGFEGRIAFVDITVDYHSVIASMASDGSDRVQLTSPTSADVGDYEPAWSPGGTSLAFTRYDAALDGEIWRMNADGSGKKRLTNNAADDSRPSWSADGSRIVFSSDRTGNYEIYTMDLNGGSIKRLTDHAADDLDPSWSPDNRLIAFVSDRRGSEELYTMKADGSAVTRLTDTAGGPDRDILPDWSPDGVRLTFTRDDLTADDADIKMVDVATGVVSTVTSDVRVDAFSVFSPAATAVDTRLIFQSFDFIAQAGDVLLWDDGVTTNLTDSHPRDQGQPDWQPIPDFPLVDAQFSTFEADIEWVYGEGITVGCSAERYCPADPVTREQMAIFLDRALDLPPTATDYFSDDTGRTGEAAINRLRAADITLGCAPGLYCPTEVVTRGQMASFLARAFSLPPTTTDYFTDDTGTTHEANINRLAASGITTGCSPTTYCPAASVTRGQMAAFLRRALED